MHRSLKSTLHFSVSYFGITAIISVPFTVKAQEEDKPGSGFEEIIVTARKRSQSLQDVPVSIQAIDTDALREKSIRDFDDYVRELTSVSFGTSGPGATTIAFRGALSQPSGFDAISSSILYLDEVPITRDGQNPDVRIVDIERLDALAGPQPTIYGAGSQSGTLKIVTVKPDMEGFSGWVEGSLSATRDGEPSYSLSAALNIPIVEDKLAIRLVGFNDAEGGFIDNVFGTTAFYSENNGDRDNADFVEENVNDYDVIGARAIVRYEPNEKWSIETGIIYQEAVVEGLFDFNPDAGFLNTVKFKDEQRVDDWYNATLTIEGDLGFADLTLAGGFHSRNIDYTFDNTAYMTAYRDVGLGIVYYVTGGSTNFDDACYYGPGYFCAAQYYDFGPNPTGTINLEQRVRSFVQEVRLTSKEDSESRFSWLIGAFYERTNNDYDYISRVDDLAEFATNAFAAYANYNPGQNIQPSDIWFDQGFIEGQTYNGLPGNDFNGFISDIESIAVFGEVSFDVTDQLTVTAGGRWFSTDFRVAENSLFLGQVSDNFDETRTTKDFSPRVNVTFEPNDDILMYFTYAEGARIGGRNGGVQTPLQMSLVPDAFDGDVLANYEIGIKSSWFDNRFIANVTAFMMNWK
ncbi:MAG: TonB-dependent receptor, partial [Pseudomonadota bacterium]